MEKSTKIEKFKKPYEDFKRTETPAGNPIVKKYEHRIDDFGAKKLKEIGERNIYEEIQEYLEDSKIENLINRVISGDVSMLRPDGQYIDLTAMPKNMIEAQQIINDLQNTWKGLPVDLRAKYNHSVEEFIGASGTAEWMEDMGLAPIKTEEIDTSAPLTNVEKGFPEEGGKE